MKEQFVLAAVFLLVLASGCATSELPPMVSTASTMTQSPDDYRPNDGDRRYARPASSRQAATAYWSDGQSAVAIEQPRPRSRAERAMDVLRRSPLWRFGRAVRGVFLGPSAPPASITATGTTMTSTQSGQVIVGQPVEVGSGIRSTVTGTPAGAVPGVTGGTALAPTAAPPGPTPTVATPVVQPTMAPGAGRVIVGPSTGPLKSTVTGTPVEPIPGLTPASAQVQSTAPSTPTVMTGTAAAPSAPVGAAVVLASPPAAAIAPAEPPPGTTVTNVQASESTVEVRTAPDGTKVIVNTEEAPEPAKKTTRAKKSRNN